ncbi:MAG TPA: pyridoxine 5'-phosphate synthase [Gammaproteobacteria bacterium]
MHELLLGVNIDHVATLRQARGTAYPDPLQAAQIAERAGADSVTVHLREDRRHIQDRDVFLLREVMRVPMNLEMAVTDEMIDVATKTRPAYCCLVPERREELTTEGGLDVVGEKNRVARACERLSGAGIRVSLFINAEAAQLKAARECGAPAVELHTGAYADASTADERERELGRLRQAAQLGTDLGLQINAGHGLNYQNVTAVAGLPEVRELNIGHSIVARAVFTGLEEAIREMRRLMREARA